MVISSLVLLLPAAALLLSCYVRGPPRPSSLSFPATAFQSLISSHAFPASHF